MNQTDLRFFHLTEPDQDSLKKKKKRQLQTRLYTLNSTEKVSHLETSVILT